MCVVSSLIMKETQLQGRQSRERTKRGTLSRMLKKIRSFGVRIGYIAEQDNSPQPAELAQ